MVDRLGLIGTEALSELCVLLGRPSYFFALSCAVGSRLGGDEVVGAEVERAEDVERDLAVEAETFEANSSDDITVLIEGTDL